MEENNAFPRKLGPYTLLKSLGQGGMGEVFLAQDPFCERVVALKQIRGPLQKFPSIRHRFLREARIAAQLSHPSIIPIFSISDDFYTMPYVEGSTFKEVLKADAKESISRLIRIFLAICQAVAYAHSRGILHRDLKPDNVIVGRFGEVLILDWGLAQSGSAEDDLEGAPEASHPSVTRAGKVVGTLAYLAPERACGKAASVQTDLYALGVILFQVLTLKTPFRRHTLELFQKRWQHEEVPNPLEVAPERDIPLPLNVMCRRMLAHDPKDRYASVDELIAELEPFIEGKADWAEAQSLDPHEKNDWEFQELIAIAKHTAISRLTDTEWVDLMISKKPFPGNLLLETEVKLHEGSRGIGFLLCCPEIEERKTLMEGLCLWIGSASHPGCQLLRTLVDVMQISSIYFAPNTTYHIRIEKVETQIKLFIDGALRLHYLSQTPLIGTKVGIIRRDSCMQLTPLNISGSSHNVNISCLSVPDAFLSYKAYPKALAEYRQIATSFAGRMEGREALYRAGITLIQAARADLSTADHFLSAALEEFGKLRHTAGAPLEYLGKSMVYRAAGDWEEEAKCLELAVRRYDKHPLFARLEEHITFRLHEASSRSRSPAYHLALLALRHLPHLFKNPDHRQILHKIQSQWLHLPYFTPNAMAAKIAFLLRRPLILMEIAEAGSWVEESLFALLELGHIEQVRLSPLSAHYPAILAALDNRADLPSHALHHYLFYRRLDMGDLRRLHPCATSPALQLQEYLACNRLAEANRLIASLSEEDVRVETSPFFVPYGCYLWRMEGEAAALTHFSTVQQTAHPPHTALLAHAVMGTLGGWESEAFFFEKLSLLRQKLLLSLALEELDKTELLKQEIKHLQSLA